VSVGAHPLGLGADGVAAAWARAASCCCASQALSSTCAASARAWSRSVCGPHLLAVLRPCLLDCGAPFRLRGGDPWRLSRSVIASASLAADEFAERRFRTAGSWYDQEGRLDTDHSLWRGPSLPRDRRIMSPASPMVPTMRPTWVWRCMVKGSPSQDSAAVLRVSDACGAAEMANFGSSVGGGRTPSCHPEIWKVVISGHADRFDQGSRVLWTAGAAGLLSSLFPSVLF
jgi:hypothetical protein